ncbi:hypothetical protein [Parasitella parasitica]|uniref:Major facilitator superfamily (MFS) profile domain-containing protein n=1 Tax=Parasitella parasitica TaxID=35722 RepID=A0A0B7N019_9FUNG|nr:hypothetical protein [Parasitella parasitica]
MEPATRILSHESTKSYLERELIVSLNDNGPMIGPTLEMMDSHHPNDEKYEDQEQIERCQSSKSTSLSSSSLSTMTKTVVAGKYNRFCRFGCMSKDNSDPKQFPKYKKNMILSVVAIGGAISPISSTIYAMSMGAGTIADIFEPHERGRAFAFYTCGPLLGPAIGPIIGGYLNQGLGWRSTFWFLAIFVFSTWLGIIFFLPETWRANPVAAPAAAAAITEKSIGHRSSDNTDLSKETLDKDIEAQKPKQAETIAQQKRSRFVNPVGALKLLRFPNIALAVTFVGIFTNFTRSYTLQYGFSSGLVGVCYLPSAAGSMVGEKAKEKGEDVHPEMRLGGFFFYASMVLQLVSFVAYGWCLEENVHFAYGLLCQFFLGLALMFPNVTLSAYMVDCFRKQGASVTACNNFARYIMAGIGSLIASDIARAMGNGPLFTFCGCLLLVFTTNLVLIKRYTLKWAALRKALAS